MSPKMKEDEMLAAQSPAMPWPAPESASTPSLTPRQRDILGLIAQGRSNKEIAFMLGIRERTVKFHVAALFVRLGTSSRTGALVAALRLGVISID
jgi:DNA-binding NarL/FixJ family response regulator